MIREDHTVSTPRAWTGMHWRGRYVATSFVGPIVVTLRLGEATAKPRDEIDIMKNFEFEVSS